MKPNNHDTKLAVLLVLSLVLGIISLISVVLIMKVKNAPQKEIQNDMVEEQVIVTEIEDNELKTNSLLKELDDLELDTIEEEYSNSSLLVETQQEAEEIEEVTEEE